MICIQFSGQESGGQNLHKGAGWINEFVLTNISPEAVEKERRVEGQTLGGHRPGDGAAR